MRGNKLIVMDQGSRKVYNLDYRLEWSFGRASKNAVPDICVNSLSVSRRHGSFQNADGYWYYLDYKGKNGTLYNGKPVTAGLGGRIKPILLTEGDVFIFGTGGNIRYDDRTVWAVFTGMDEDTVQFNEILLRYQ